jgi:cytochrome c5
MQMCKSGTIDMAAPEKPIVRRIYMRPILSFFILVSAFGFLFSSGVASGQNLNGKELYRNNCKVCHDQGSPHGRYAPLTLTQEQWRSFFKMKFTPMHKTAVHPKSGNKLFEQLTPEQIKAIQRFAIDHAADSEQPATCG